MMMIGAGQRDRRTIDLGQAERRRCNRSSERFSTVLVILSGEVGADTDDASITDR
jgi:hypothetical protein